MIVEQIDRQKCKWETAELLRDAQVSPKGITALCMGLAVALGLLSSVAGSGFFGIFISILSSLLTSVLGAGLVLYCMAVRRGERAEYLTLFDGFSFVGKLIMLNIVTGFFVFLWLMLFIVPGIIAAYRYSFARYNLYENPGIGVMEALESAGPVPHRLPEPDDGSGSDGGARLRHSRPRRLLWNPHSGAEPSLQRLEAAGVPVLLPELYVRPARLFRNRQAHLRRGGGGGTAPALRLGRLERPGRAGLTARNG